MNKFRRNRPKKKWYKVALSKLTFHKLDWLEYLTLGVGFWFFFYPKPYVVLFTILLCMPFIGLFVSGLSGRPSIASLVKVSGEEGNEEYDVADFIDFAAWVILYRVLVDYEFENYYSMIIPGIVGFVLMLIVLLATHKLIAHTTKSKTWIYLSLTFNIFLYSIAATYGANCVYDNAEPVVYQAAVVDKWISKGRKGSTTYYVRVMPWGHNYDKEAIRISSSQYNEIQIGSTINIDLKKGLFNIPWYYVE